MHLSHFATHMALTRGPAKEYSICQDEGKLANNRFLIFFTRRDINEHNVLFSDKTLGNCVKIPAADKWHA